MSAPFLFSFFVVSSWDLSLILKEISKSHMQLSQLLIIVQSQPLTPSGGCLIVSVSLCSFTGFIYSLSKQLRRPDLQTQQVGECYLSSLTCCVHMECVDTKGSCLHCLFICVHVCIQTCSYLRKPAANDCAYIGRLCNGASVIQDFAWTLMQHV